METKFVADTHALLWYLTADARPSVNARVALEAPNDQIIVPAIVVAESPYIIEHGKSPAATSQLWNFILLSANVVFHPLDLPILKKNRSHYRPFLKCMIARSLRRPSPCKMPILRLS